MQARATTHPPDRLLRDFGNGKLEGDVAATIAAHLDECPDCLNKVAGISSDGFLEAFRRARPGDSYAATSLETNPESDRAADRLALPKTTSADVAPLHEESVPLELVDHPDYEILRVLGSDGTGMVLLARNRIVGRSEVLKVIRSDTLDTPGRFDRFLREIRAVALLQHPNIVAAYSAFRVGGSLVLAMEHVEGLNLARLVKARGPLPLAHACNFIYQAATGLQHAHQKGLVHRDIKPGNLMLCHEAGRAVIKILDFRLAKATLEQSVLESRKSFVDEGAEASSDLTLDGQILGTPGFIAPEQLTDPRTADIRADIYSLGCTLYFLLAGGPPFQGSQVSDVLQAHHSRDEPWVNGVRPDVPVELAALVGKMMAKEPRKRFQTPDEVATRLLPYFKKTSKAAGKEKQGFVLQPQVETEEAMAGSVAKPPARPAGLPEPACGAGHDKPEPEKAEPRWEELVAINEEEDHDSDRALVNLTQGHGRARRLGLALCGVALLTTGLLGALLFRMSDRAWQPRPVDAPKPQAKASPDSISGGEPDLSRNLSRNVNVVNHEMKSPSGPNPSPARGNPPMQPCPGGRTGTGTTGG